MAGPPRDRRAPARPWHVAAAIDALLDQLGDAELGEQVLQLVRHQLDRGDDKLADTVCGRRGARAGDAGKRLDKELARVEKEHAKGAPRPRRARGKRQAGRCRAPFDPTRDPSVAAVLTEHTALLRLLGYLARPELADACWSGSRGRIARARCASPRSRRCAASSPPREAKGTETAIEALIEYADGDDLGIAQAAIDTLRGARVPEKLAKPFAALARSKNPAAQKLAMERLARRRWRRRGQGADRRPRRRRRRRRATRPAAAWPRRPRRCCR